MPIEKRPTNNLPPNYVPPGGTPYKVKTNDDWESVARAHGITENELVYFNFGTVHPTEVNWYLRQNVGCTRPTHDQKNWMFTSDASPGIIYLPPRHGWKRPVFPQTVPSPDSPQPAPSSSGIWYGLGGQEGGILAIGGAGTTQAWMFSADSYDDHFWMSIQSYRVGPGLGSSAGGVFVLATGVQTPGDLQGFKLGWQFDFQFDFGPKWGDLAKALKNLKFARNLAKTARAASFMEKTLSPKEWKELGEAIKVILEENERLSAAKDLYEGEKSARHNEKKVVVVPLSIIPGAGECLGIGLEASIYFQNSTVRVYHEHHS